MTEIKTMKIKTEQDEKNTETPRVFRGYKYKTQEEAFEQTRKKQYERNLKQENIEKSHLYNKSYYQTTVKHENDLKTLHKKIDSMIRIRNGGVEMALSVDEQLFKDMADSLFGNKADEQLQHSLFKIIPRLPLGSSDKLSDAEKASQNFIFSKPKKPTFAEMDNGFFGSMII
jgi:hypothetical protein